MDFFASLVFVLLLYLRIQVLADLSFVDGVNESLVTGIRSLPSTKISKYELQGQAKKAKE